MWRFYTVIYGRGYFTVDSFVGFFFFLSILMATERSCDIIGGSAVGDLRASSCPCWPQVRYPWFILIPMIYPLILMITVIYPLIIPHFDLSHSIWKFSNFPLTHSQVGLIQAAAMERPRWLLHDRHKANMSWWDSKITAIWYHEEKFPWLQLNGCCWPSLGGLWWISNWWGLDRLFTSRTTQMHS